MDTPGPAGACPALASLLDRWAEGKKKGSCGEDLGNLGDLGDLRPRDPWTQGLRETGSRGFRDPETWIGAFIHIGIPLYSISRMIPK